MERGEEEVKAHGPLVHVEHIHPAVHGSRARGEIIYYERPLVAFEVGPEVHVLDRRGDCFCREFPVPHPYLPLVMGGSIRRFPACLYSQGNSAGGGVVLIKEGRYPVEVGNEYLL